MTQSTMIVLVVVAVVVLAAVGWLVWQRRRSEVLREQYGPEYDRTVRQMGDQRRAESELMKRQERVEQLDIRPLSASQRSDYTDRWRTVQAKFVDDPKGAVTDADGLVADVLEARGYPVADFDQRAADLSVRHPRVVENYRAARDIAQRHRRGEATTEDLRQAMVFYRALFQDLLEDREHVSEREMATAAARNGEREVERTAARADERIHEADERVREHDDEATQIPIQRVTSRPNGTEREVRS
jgi:type II secretory pathway pseudopilin PulG